MSVPSRSLLGYDSFSEYQPDWKQNVCHVLWIRTSLPLLISRPHEAFLPMQLLLLVLGRNFETLRRDVRQKVTQS